MTGDQIIGVSTLLVLTAIGSFVGGLVFSDSFWRFMTERRKYLHTERMKELEHRAKWIADPAPLWREERK